MEFLSMVLLLNLSIKSNIYVFILNETLDIVIFPSRLLKSV